MKKFFLLAALAFAAALPNTATAQTQAATASVTVGDILALSIDNASIAFGTVTSAGMKSIATTTTATYSGNTTFSVRLKADTQFFDAVVAANDNLIPASRLQVRVGAGAFGALNHVTQTGLVTSSAPGNGTSTVGYQLDIQSLDPKDTYTLGLTYSIIAG